MIALALYEDSMVCPLCGGPISECTDPANEHAYKTDPPTRCFKTTEQLRFMSDDWDKRPHNRALMLITRLIRR